MEDPEARSPDAPFPESDGGSTGSRFLRGPILSAVGRLGGGLSRPVVMRVLGWVVVLFLLWWALRDVPWEEMLAMLSRLRPAHLLFIALVNVAAVAAASARLWVLLRFRGHRLPFGSLVRHWLAAFSVGYFMPGPQLGGSPVQIYLLRRDHNLPLPQATAAVLVSKSIEWVGSMTLVLFGLFGLLRARLFSEGTRGLILLVALGLLLLPLLYLAAAWAGRRPLTALLDRSPAWLAGRASYSRFRTGACETEEYVTVFCRESPLALLLASALTLLAWTFVLIQAWLGLTYMGLHAGPLAILSAIAASQMAFATPLPGGLGAQEAILIFAFRGLGYSAAAGAGLALLTRVRDLAIALLGLLVGGWSFMFSRREAQDGPEA